MKILFVFLFFFSGIIRTSSAAVFNSADMLPAAQIEDQTTQIEIRYDQPAAETVEIIWGINGWETAPVSWRPNGTYIEKDLMVSPMEKQDGLFTVILHVDPGTNVDFGFRIAPIAFRSDSSPLWEVDGANDFHTQVMQDSTLTIESKLTNIEIWGFESSDTQTRIIDYVAPFAESVTLTWGLNGWLPLPTVLLPEGTTISETGLMQTTMEEADDVFSTRLSVPPDVIIDFGFTVAMLDQDSSKSEIWDGDYQQSAEDESLIRIQSSIEQSTVAKPALIDSSWNIWIVSASLVLILVGVVATIGITRKKGFSSQDSRDLVSWRDLLIELVTRDIKLRYRRSVLGILWSLINPLLQLAVLGFVFRFILPLDIENYTLFLFIGLLSWIWFQSSISSGTTSIVDNRGLIHRPGFPITILPIVPVISNLIHFLLSLPVVLLILILTGNAIFATAIFLPLIIVVQFLFILSLANILAIFQVFFRDTEHIMSVLLLLWFYLSPIFYNSEIIPEQFQSVYALNPLVHIINGYRDLLMYGQLPPLLPLLIIGAISLPIIYIGRLLLLRNYNRFVEEL